MIDLAPSKRSRATKLTIAGLFAATSIVLGACGGGGGTTTPPRLIVGAISVGSIHDAGYNQAEHDGLVPMTKSVVSLKLRRRRTSPRVQGSSR